jgi:hypothetical protein
LPFFVCVNLRLIILYGLAQPNQAEADQPWAEADPSQPKADPSSGGLWRSLGAKNFVEVILLDILSVRIQESLESIEWGLYREEAPQPVRDKA